MKNLERTMAQAVRALASTTLRLALRALLLARREFILPS